jgi:TRAP-type C4-dicarboxylate transport system permease large subunit
MQVVILFLGMFIEQASIMMITLPIFMPIVNAFGFNEVWFGMITLINLGIANRTPPFGFLLFVLKGVLPEDTRMGEIYRSAMPYVFCDLAVASLLILIPPLAYWLPNLIR